jgi:hypothetical protein
MSKGQAPAGEWPPPIQSADQAVELFERMRRLGCAISEWCTDEQSERNFSAKIERGLSTQALASGEAARAVAADLGRLMETLKSDALNVATVAALLGSKIKAHYVDPITEAQAVSPRTRSPHGLKVNK